MHGLSLRLVLLGLGASSTWAAPAPASPSATLPERATTDALPPGCIPQIWELFHFCIIAPPTTTIGPSNKKREPEIAEERGTVDPDPTPTTGTCIPSIWDKYKICIIAPPITTITPSDKRQDTEEFQVRALKADPTTTTGTCIPSIWDWYKICIIAPPTTTIGPSNKRRALSTDQCSNVESVQTELDALLSKPGGPSPPDVVVIQQLATFLLGCGVTEIGISNKKRDIALRAEADFDLTGLQTAYEIFLQQPTLSLDTWLIMQYAADVLEYYGVDVERAPAGTTTTFVSGRKRQGGVFTIGGSCQLNDVVALKAVLAALASLYGDPAKSPANIFLVEQLVVTGLQACGQNVPGWTVITPGNPIPGGPIVPDPTVPGGPITPDPTIPGGPITPDDPTVPGGGITPSN